MRAYYTYFITNLIYFIQNLHCYFSVPERCQKQHESFPTNSNCMFITIMLTYLTTVVLSVITIKTKRRIHMVTMVCFTLQELNLTLECRTSLEVH